MPPSPPAPAGYSGAPLSRKLGILPASRVLLLHAPTTFRPLLEPLPAHVVISVSLAARKPHDIVVVFVNSQDALGHLFSKCVDRLTPAGGLWVAWPKKSSGVPTDLSENIIRDLCLDSGLVDNKVCAIDKIWSGLRFVRRRENR